MQLLGVDHSSFHRNRLTHSLEVAQIARTIATGLELKSPVVSETCSLAHDIGNPPFGHSGEQILNELSEDIGGYEGNAQAIRILRTLENKYPDVRGLNLTARTLLGLAKYFNIKGQGEKPNKLLYADDYKVLNEVWESKSIIHRKTIDLQIMDLSDEIAYAAHDLEDSLTLGYFSIGEILHEFKTNKDFSPAYDTFRGIVKEAQEHSGKLKGIKSFSSEEYSTIFRRELTSKLVDTLVRDIGIGPNCYNESLVFKKYHLLSKGLKNLVFSSLLRKQNIQIYEKMGEKVIRGLFDMYSDTSFNKDNLLLPVEYRSTTNDDSFKRSVIDYISGMMDTFAVNEYKKYYGRESLDKIYPV